MRIVAQPLPVRAGAKPAVMSVWPKRIIMQVPTFFFLSGSRAHSADDRYRIIQSLCDRNVTARD